MLEPMGDPSEHVDDEVPWAMQFAVDVPKAHPPSRTHVAEAALAAGALVLADERSLPGGPWYDRVRTWNDGRIRKVVRRGRGAPFVRACAYDGITVTVGTATVRAFVPGPTDDVPIDLSRLQVSGTDLDDADRRTSFEVPAGWDGIVVAVSPHVTMTALKTAAQVAHCGTVAWLDMAPDRRQRWVAAGCASVVVLPDAAGWDRFDAAADVRITDAGFTEVAPGSHTASGRWQLDGAGLLP